MWKNSPEEQRKISLKMVKIKIGIQDGEKSTNLELEIQSFIEFRVKI